MNGVPGPGSLPSRVQVEDGVVYRELEGEAVLLNLTTGLYYGLPNLANFSAIATAAYGAVVPAPRILAATAYAALYCGVLLSIAVLVFERRDFK